jgi:hypothetical protein
MFADADIALDSIDQSSKSIKIEELVWVKKRRLLLFRRDGDVEMAAGSLRRMRPRRWRGKRNRSLLLEL